MIENCNMILIEKQQKHQHYHQVKLPQKQLNNLIIDKLKEISQLQNIIKSGEMDYESRAGKNKFLVNTHYLLFFKKYTRGKFDIKRW